MIQVIRQYRNFSSRLPLLFFICAALFQPVQAEPLPQLGTAPSIDLISQHGEPFSLKDVRGKVAVINFVFTRCGDRCPVLITKLQRVKSKLGEHFTRDVHFVSVTLDAAFDRPEILNQWASALGVQEGGWSFLTGNPIETADVIKRYGVFGKNRGGASIDHNLLTSIVDPNGELRVQYMGDRFDPDEFAADILTLIHP